MKGYYWKVETTHPAGILLLLFSLFASMSLTPSEYLDCGSLFPDENSETFLDLASFFRGIFPQTDQSPNGFSDHFALLNRFNISSSPEATARRNLTFTVASEIGSLARETMMPRGSFEYFRDDWGNFRKGD
jgi:hypothetical protein